jgi:hypothetical protein
MRLTFFAVLMLAMASPAFAAPTCQDRQGHTVRCGTETAMPVGWKAPPYDRVTPPAGNRRDMVIAAGAIILILALIALLPEFDGSKGRDWEK